MKETLQEIRKLLKKEVFQDEQHVRFSLVGRICQKLGWDIWNPAEFFTEYKVERLPTQSLPQGSNGRVDIALFLSGQRTPAAEVFMEIKAPGKLMAALEQCEDQLHAYAGHHRIAIGVLSDGIVWRFYVPTIGGYFRDSLFAELNLLTDDIDTLTDFFNAVLHKERFRKKAQNTAEQMHEELGKIILVQKVKEEANRIAKRISSSAFEVAKGMLKTDENIDLELEEIKKLWDRRIPNLMKNKQVTQAEQSPKIISTAHDDLPVFTKNKNYRASAIYHRDSKQVTLLKGSEIRVEHFGSFPSGAKKLKNELLALGDLTLNVTKDKYILNKDILFKRPSGAATFVLGASSNGYIEWQDKNGNVLDKYMEKKE